MSTSIFVVKFSSGEDSKATKSRVNVEDNATLKDLRSILDKDGIMTSDDSFEDGDGVGISKSSEGSIKCSELLKDNQIHVRSAAARKIIPLPTVISRPSGSKDAQATVMGEASTREAFSTIKEGAFGSAVMSTEASRNVNDLEPEEIKTLQTPALDGASNPLKDASSCHVNRVVEPINPDLIGRIPINESKQSTAISRTSREASYAEAGWVEAEISTENPWVSGKISGGYESSSSSSSSDTTIVVTGRWAYTKCRLSLPMGGLQPEPSLKAAVEKALSLSSENEQRESLMRVFNEYGYNFISAVEMGGFKFTSSERHITAQMSRSDYKMHMEAALSTKFGAVDVTARASGGTSSSSTTSTKNEFESNNYLTRGGNIEVDDIGNWKKSLGNFRTWMPVRPVQIRPIIKLFDEETQARILKLAPSVVPTPEMNTFGREDSVPLYRLLTPDRFYHFYCVRDDQKDRAIQHGYIYEGIAGRVLPSAKHGAVTFHHFQMNWFHIYSTDPKENEKDSNKIFNMVTYQNQGNAGFIFTNQVEGTVPLYCMHHNGTRDNLYTTSGEELSRVTQSGSYISEGIVGYVFPA